MKRKSIFFCALLSVAVFVTAQSADDIVKSSRDRITATTVSTRSRMVIQAKDGSTTERLLDQYSSDAGDTTRAMIVFQRPASVAGTRFLTIEKEQGSEDRWMYLPALGKVRRIAASEGSGSFVGTDFSYDDISSANRNLSLDTHVLKGEEKLDGKDCYVIESTPKDSSYQYSKMVQWIEKDGYLSRKIELYDKKDVLVKRVEILATKDFQGRITPTETRMSTLADGTSTTIFIDIMKYDSPIPDGVFTTNYLSTGRY